MESLLGVLYSGFCGAILFGKVLRIQSHAQVIFSDPIVIRYGSGVADGADFDNSPNSDDEGGLGKMLHAKKIPCPVLEFRIVNRLFNEAGGEIMDATLNVVANVDANDADPSLIDALDSNRNRYNLNGRNEDISVDTNSESENHSESGQEGSTGVRSNHLGNVFPRFLDPFHSLMGKIDHQAVDEDPTARLVSKRIFSKMLIEASDHPFFKRVW